MWLWDGATSAPRGRAGILVQRRHVLRGHVLAVHQPCKLIGDAPLLAGAVPHAGASSPSWAAYHALLGWAGREVPAGARRACAGWWAFPAAWLLIEWWRSWFLTGFGWLALGYAHTDNWLGALAPVVGQFGLGSAHAAAGGRAGRRCCSATSASASSAAALFVAIWVVALRVARHRVDGALRPARSGGGGAGRRCRRTKNGSTSNLDVHPRAVSTRTREAHGADLIVWPESAIPDLANNHIDFYRDVYAGGERARLVAGDGHAARRGRIRRPAKRNTSTRCWRWTSPRPASAGTTSITSCRSSEFVPGAAVRAPLAQAHEPAVFGFQSRRGAAGAARGGAGRQIAASVCYEDAYGSTQLPALRTATMLVNVTNDSWFGHSTGALPAPADQPACAPWKPGGPWCGRPTTACPRSSAHRGEIVAAAPEYEANVMRATRAAAYRSDALCAHRELAGGVSGACFRPCSAYVRAARQGRLEGAVNGSAPAELRAIPAGLFRHRFPHPSIEGSLICRFSLRDVLAGVAIVAFAVGACSPQSSVAAAAAQIRQPAPVAAPAQRAIVAAARRHAEWPRAAGFRHARRAGGSRRRQRVRGREGAPRRQQQSSRRGRGRSRAGILPPLRHAEPTAAGPRLSNRSRARVRARASSSAPTATSSPTRTWSRTRTKSRCA